MKRSSLFFVVIVVACLMDAGCISLNITTQGDTPHQATVTPVSTDAQPLNTYQQGDVIAYFDWFLYGYVITRYEPDTDLYYGFKVEKKDDAWGIDSTFEWEIGSKEKTEEDYPFVVGHIDL